MLGGRMRPLVPRAPAPRRGEARLCLRHPCGTRPVSHRRRGVAWCARLGAWQAKEPARRSWLLSESRALGAAALGTGSGKRLGWGQCHPSKD